MGGGSDEATGNADLADALESLKRRGCLLLLTGRTPPETTRRAVRRVLGSSRAPRRRVVVRTDPDGTDAYDDVPGARVVDVRDVVRAARPDGLDVVLERVRGAVDGAVEDAPPDPAELRVVVDDTASLVDAWGVEPVVEFLDGLAAAARTARAMIAARLDRDEAALSADLAAVPDVRIELRRDCDVDCDCSGGRGGPCQRVHLPDRAPSAWTPL
jgi:hypothetical protein